MLVNNVEDSEEEEPRFSTYSEEGMTKTNDEEETMPTSRKWEGNEMVGPIVRKNKPHHRLH